MLISHENQLTVVKTYTFNVIAFNYRWVIAVMKSAKSAAKDVSFSLKNPFWLLTSAPCGSSPSRAAGTNTSDASDGSDSQKSIVTFQ